MTEFTLEDLQHDISPVARDIICDVVLSWARLDSLISQLVLLAFGLPIDGGTILLGQMDTRSKLDRLKRLYDHHGMQEAAESIANLRSWHKRFVDVRNSISHHTCAGSWKSNPSMIVFAPVRAMQGTLDHVEIEHIPLSDMNAATDFATKAADAIKVAVEPLPMRRALPPPEPPPFAPPSPPNSQKRATNGRVPRHKAPGQPSQLTLGYAMARVTVKSAHSKMQLPKKAPVGSSSTRKSGLVV